MSGKRLSTQAPYGYLRDRDGNLSVDPETAPVIRLIFQLAAEGNGPGKIAAICGKWKSSHRGRWNLSGPDEPKIMTRYDLAIGIAARLKKFCATTDYLGHTVNFKTTRKSYKAKRKSKSRRKTGSFENTHEALISQEIWEIVQKNRKTGAGPPVWAIWACSPACYIAPTAAIPSISTAQNHGRERKTVTPVVLTSSRKANVPHTLSGR